MRIVGIDPGSERTGYGCVETDGRRHRLVTCGAITAAAFLREFAGALPWAHLDIAGTAWAETKEPYQPKGATGVAVRTLIEIAMNGVQDATGGR